MGLIQRGVYTADRAAALAGVPKSTLHYWARTELLVPSVSPSKEKLWSFADLVCLRIIAWLRREKPVSGLTVLGTRIQKVRATLRAMEERGVHPWVPSGSPWGASPIVVTPGGDIFLREADGTTRAGVGGQLLLGDRYLDVLGPFDEGQIHGPDLLRPGRFLRIVPGKLSGQPHIEGTRIPSVSIAALRDDGITVDGIHRLYPEQSRDAIQSALDLEDWLRRNLAVRAA